MIVAIDLSTTVVAIVLDLSEPWNVQASLDKWLRGTLMAPSIHSRRYHHGDSLGCRMSFVVLQTQIDKQMAKLTDDEKVQLRTNGSKSLHSFLAHLPPHCIISWCMRVCDNSEQNRAAVY